MNTRPKEKKAQRKGVNWKAFILLWLVIVLVTLLALLGSALKRYYSAQTPDEPPAAVESAAPEEP